uniref:MAE_28990/MAE_18760 family HEPN-like nuclease n=1 Tax=Mesonia mobilis TaxID=369791 RepID=UPI0024BA338C
MSKNLFSFDILSDKVIGEFSWRRKELTLLKNKIPLVKNPLQSAMIRATLPLLYAHWEGFVKVSLSYYLEYVSYKGLKHNELKTQFIALSLQNKIGSLKENNIESKTQII